MKLKIDTQPNKAKPFLKWAGGKSQLLEQMAYYIHSEVIQGRIKRYVEPFVGGGALFFHMAQKYDIEEFAIWDINLELIQAYQTIQKDVQSLIDALRNIENSYKALSPDEQSFFFYDIRARFNDSSIHSGNSLLMPVRVERSAQFIFLNRTCFNGLYRVNSKGDFNVPFGKYKNPSICAEDNLKAISQILQHTDIRYGDFESCESLVDEETFVYFDPPYRPISQTASFNSYSKYDFNDDAQLRLAAFYRKLDEKGAKLMLSNSDPKNENPCDDFFENAYRGYHIERVKANRIINCNAEKRGAIDELLIMNYNSTPCLNNSSECKGSEFQTLSLPL